MRSGKNNPHRVHANRIAGGHCHYCDPDRPSVAGRAEGPRSGARMSCQNNLKQLALGVHLYENSNGKSLTALRWTSISQECPGNDLVGLYIPYIEQGNLYSLYNPQAGYNTAGNLAVGSVSIKIFRCPSGRRTSLGMLESSGGFERYNALLWDHGPGLRNDSPLGNPISGANTNGAYAILPMLEC